MTPLATFSRIALLLSVLSLFLVLPGVGSTTRVQGHGPGPTPFSTRPGMALIVGVAEDSPKSHRVAESETAMDLVCQTGTPLLRMTQTWVRSQRELSDRDRAALRNAVSAAASCNLQVMLTIMPHWKRELAPTPIRPSDRRYFCDFAQTVIRDVPGLSAIEIGNEPNWDFFFRPQFDAEGRSVAPAIYERLLALCYDRLKATDPELIVVGGALASTGTDNPWGKRKTTSPNRFWLGVGAAYRASGRDRPIMDCASHHPYPDHSSEAPAAVHARSSTIGVNDYEKLVAALSQAFDGTAQSGSDLCLIYSELGFETEIPEAKRGLYRGEEPARNRVITEARQAE